MKSIFSFNLTQQQYMRLAKGSPLLPFFVFIPLALSQLGLALWHFKISFLLTLGSFGIGFFSWGVQEYFLHRFPFHWHTHNGFLKFITSGFHSLHHQIPQSKEYIVTPIYFAVLSFIVVECLFYGVSNNLAVTHALGAGWAVGYLYYEWVHFLCHHKTLNTKYYQRLKEAHLQHHFKTPKKIFGVSYPFWDYVFGTYDKPTTSLHQNQSQ